jgi:hypothetical protein
MKRVPCKAMFDWLIKIAPPGELAALLQPPESLYQFENAFSSDASVSALSLTGFFFSGETLPKDMPEYSVAISAKGNTAYFMLVDKRRKIIVSAPIRQSEGYWENAIICVRSALREAKASGKLTISTEDGVSRL